MSVNAFADQLPGQIEGGNSNYQISNVTQVSGFANTQSAGVCDILQYRLHLYNPGPGSINDVKVEANINTITPYTTYNSVATAYTPDGLTPQTSFEATLNLSSAQTQSYIADSTELLNSAGNVISRSANGTLADTITDGAGGIDIGSLGESVDEYLEFQAKVNCPYVPPVLVPATCNLLSTPVVNGDNVTINSVNYTANSASVSGTNINYGNGVAATYTSTDYPVTYTYPNSGKYTITATVLTNLGNVTSNACRAAITITHPTPPIVPPTCNLLSTPTVNGDNVTISSVNYTANSAQVSGTSINFGNGTANTYKSTDFPISYTYSNPGNYTITATVLTNLGNVTSNACSAAITIAAHTTPVPPTTPTTPTSLVNTGPGNIFAVAGIATVLGTIGHYFYRSRKLGRSLF
jgi:PKD repeat protein